MKARGTFFWKYPAKCRFHPDFEPVLPSIISLLMRYFGNQGEILMIAHFATDRCRKSFYSGATCFAQGKSTVYGISLRENTISTKIFIYS